MTGTVKISRRVLIFTVLTAAALAAAVLGLLFGSAWLDFGQVWNGLWGGDANATESLILHTVRLPRVAAGLLAGAGLALSGALLQAATGNALAGPSIIGVNAGAGFAMILCLCFFPMSYQTLPLAAFLGAFACTMLIVLIAGKVGGSKVTIVLAGVAISSLLNAGISFLKLLFPDHAVSYNYFAIGGVDGVTFPALAAPALITLAAFLAAWVMAGRLNLLCLGDAIASSLGVRVKLLRMAALILASLLAGAAVSFAGLLGFVGLMVPHMARRLLGSDLRLLLPACALLGGTLVTLADLLGRVVFAPSQIPAGIITAFIGVPFFFILLMQRRNRL